MGYSQQIRSFLLYGHVRKGGQLPIKPENVAQLNKFIGSMGCSWITLYLVNLPMQVTNVVKMW